MAKSPAKCEPSPLPEPREGRPHGIPPAPPLRPAFGVLSVADETAAVALFQAVRNTQLWAVTPAARRPALFRRVNDAVRERLESVAESVPLLADSLAVFLALQEAPGTMDAERLGLAWFRVWEWADRCGLADAALHAAEAAARAAPEHPKYAAAAGFTAQRIGGRAMWTRAEGWLARAAALALRAKDARERVRALTHQASLLVDMGRLDEAEAAYNRAIALAMHGQKRRAAVAHHHLMVLHYLAGRLDRSAEHAARAFDLYRRQDERLPFLASDLAVLLVARRCFAPALPLLDAATRTMPRPHEHGLLHGVTAHAAGGIGRRGRYEQAERAALECAALDAYRASATLDGLARGAWHLGHAERAETHARAALVAARRVHDTARGRDAVALLRVLREQRQPPSAVELEPGASELSLARRLAARLRAGGSRKAPGSASSF